VVAPDVEILDEDASEAKERLGVGRRVDDGVERVTLPYRLRSEETRERRAVALAGQASLERFPVGS
jgi:hypothetical protein